MRGLRSWSAQWCVKAARPPIVTGGARSSEPADGSHTPQRPPLETIDVLLGGEYWHEHTGASAGAAFG